MLFNTRSYAVVGALSYLLPTVFARAVWIQEDFDPMAGSNRLIPRQSNTCATDSSLLQCPSDFKSDFCCPSGTTCLHISTDPSITAAICCPVGGNCTKINPVSCDINKQNATQIPFSQLHADPPQQLDTCGSGCCPMGFSCENSLCIAKVAPSAIANPTSSSTTTSGATSTTQPSSTSTSDADSNDQIGAASSSHFSGASFAAGFIPGIIIGALLVGLLIFLLLRKKRHSSEDYVTEKRKHRDTLTDLGTYRPTHHGRSISEPTVDPSTFHRTDFLRSTPPRAGETAAADDNEPVTPNYGLPKVKALFSRSPFLTQTPATPRTDPQEPLPAHMKRGTLSFHVSPIRALKKQKSMHSLRRANDQASRNNSQRRGQGQNGLSRSESTETIQVLMPSDDPYTPDTRPARIPEETLSSTKYQAPKSSTTWNSGHTKYSPPSISAQEAQAAGYASSSRYPSEIPQAPYDTPTRPPLPRSNTAGIGVAIGDPSAGFLGSPYTPTNQKGKLKAGTRLAVERDPADTRRDTTFSAMMEKAGLRKSDLIVGKR